MVPRFKCDIFNKYFFTPRISVNVILKLIQITMITLRDDIELGCQ